MEVLPKIPSGFKEDSWKCPLIRKGFVRRGYIQERPGLHPAVRFVYQPMLPEKSDEMTYKVGLLRPQDSVQTTSIMASFLMQHVKEWSIEGLINEVSFRSLGEALLNRIRVIVCQLGPSDIDPLWEDETSTFKQLDELMGESSEPLPLS